MKNLYILLITLFVFTYCNAQIVDIPDEIFREMLVNYPVVDTDGDDIGDSDADTNNDGEIQVSEAEAVEWLDVSSPFDLGLSYINSLVGIESFINLKKLDCEINGLENLDVTQLSSLEYLNCRGNVLTDLNVSQNPNLTFLWCTSNELTELNVTQNSNLDFLKCSSNLLTELDISQNPNLKSLAFVSNQISTIDISQNLLLELLMIGNNQISNIDLTQHTNITTLTCYRNELTELDISQNLNLLEIDFSWNPISNIDFSQNLLLLKIRGSVTNISTLDVTNNPELYYLGFGGTNITTLDVSQNSELLFLYVSNNYLTHIDLSQNINLTNIKVDDNLLTSLNLQNGNNSNFSRMTSLNNPSLSCIQVDDVAYSNAQECIIEPTIITGWCIDDWTSFSEDCPEPFVYIPDTNFLNALVNTNCADLDGNGTIDSDADINDDGQIQMSEAEAVYGLYVSNNDISSLEGVQNFINLTSLDCSVNQLASLNISNGNNINITNFNAVENTELNCIEVDDVDYANNAPNWFKDNWAAYSEECILGLEDNTQISFTIYPNPTQDILFIETQQPIESIKTYNLQGQQIKEGTSNSLDVSQLTHGLYFVQIVIDEQSLTKKFIKE